MHTQPYIIEVFDQLTGGHHIVSFLALSLLMFQVPVESILMFFVLLALIYYGNGNFDIF